VNELLGIEAPRQADESKLYKLLNQWAAKRARNVLRTVYAEGKNALQDLGISLPPQMRNVELVLGWPMKAVQVLAARIVFDGFVIAGAEQDPFGLSDWLTDNNADAVLPQAFQSSLIHSVAFLTVTPGGPGEPDVLLLPKSAREATGLWDPRTNSLTDGLSVTATDDLGFPTQFVWYARDHVTTFTRNSEGKWSSESQGNPLGRVWMEPLPFRPDLERPFGRSRVSRAVMSLTDAGLRTLARSEAHAEFFASPQRYALGLDEEAFGSKKDRWDAVMSRFLSISRDENGDLPTLGQFSQMSMQPHFDHLRTLAALFAGETSVPLNSLGIVQDNPSSAEAIYAAKEDLVIEARAATDVWGGALRRAAVTAVMMRDGLTEPPAELRGLRAKWRNPATPSVVSASDALVKQVTAMPWLAESEVALEMLGYDDATITRLLSDKRRAQAGSVLNQVLARQTPTVPGPVAADDVAG